MSWPRDGPPRWWRRAPKLMCSVDACCLGRPADETATWTSALNDCPRGYRTSLTVCLMRLDRAVWREAFLEIEGWSDAYRGGGDDIDFCIRAQLAGFVIGYVPEASVNYAAKPGLKAALLQQIRYGAGIARLANDFAGVLPVAPPDPRFGRVLRRAVETLGYIRPPVRWRFWLGRVALSVGYYLEARRLDTDGREYGGWFAVNRAAAAARLRCGPRRRSERNIRLFCSGSRRS